MRLVFCVGAVTIMVMMLSFLTGRAGAEDASTGPTDVYGFSFQAIDGTPLPLSDFKGRAVLIVNTASRCGFTKQYAGLQSLYETYKDQGFVVLGVPANNFANQEPGTAAEIKKFCESIYRITFPLTEKTSVVGQDAHPFYQWAAAQKKGGVLFSTPRWNFHKYLITPDGKLAGSFASTVEPESKELIRAVEAVLPQPVATP